MKKNTLLFLVVVLNSIAVIAQHTFPAVAGPINVAAGTPVTININDAANSAGVPAGVYPTFSVSADWGNPAGNPWSSEADLDMITASGTVSIDPPTSGGANNANITTLTFEGAFTADYDASVDGTLDIVLNQSFGGSSADWSNIVVTIFPPITCPEPTALTASNITTSSADLGWTESGTATVWNVELVDITGGGTATGTPTAVGVVNPYELTGLEQNNSYEFYVQADCGGAVSTWAGPFAFNTACDVFIAPYTEDFETFTTAASAFSNENCWSGSGGAYYWESAPGTDTGSGSTGPDPTITTGNYFYTEASAGTAGDITELSAPMVDLSALTNPSLSFSYHMFGVQIGTLDVVVNGTVEFTLTGQQQASATDPFLPVFVDLAAYTGQTIQVIFRATSAGTFEGDIAIDNVSFDETPSCFAPSALSAFNIDGFSADVTWTENGTASLYNLELVDITAGGTQTMTATHAGVGNPSTFTGLDPENDYEYYVQADCGGSGVSAWVGPFAFSTTVACPAPFGLNATNITASSADLSWTAGASETLWNVEVVDVTAGGTQTMTPTATGVANPYMLTGLTDANDYAFYVQADCTGTAGVSTWAGPFNFTTACNAILAPYTEDFESFTVASSAFNSENCWTGTNIGGYLWEVAATTDTSSTGTGPGSGVSSGNYLFTEATSGATGDAIDLISPSIDLSGLTTPALIFDYHMFGADMGTLDVLVNGTTNVFSLMGQQQTAETDSFITAIVDLSAFTGQTIQVTFRGTKGAGFTSDMAIDNVSFNELPACDAPMATFTVVEDCTNGFTVDINVTDLGSATSYDVQNGGVSVGTITATGVTNVGPFTNGTAVDLTIVHSSDTICNVSENGLVNATLCPTEVTCGSPVNNTFCYGNNESLEWLYTSADGTSTIGLTVVEGQMETCCDTFTIYDGTDATGTVLFSGNGTLAAATYASTGTSLYVTLTSDISVSCINNGYTPINYNVDCYVAPPANDECATAEALTLGTEVSADNTGATDSMVTGDCFTGAIADLWYSFVATSTGEVTITTTAAQYGVYSDCTGTQVGACNTSVVNGLTDGTTYYVRVSDDGTARAQAPGPFTLTVAESSLSVDDFNAESLFSYYPNPVNDNLTLQAQKEITNVSVYNMIGQEVYRNAPNTLTNEVNMSNLQSGAYFVKVTVGNTTETIKVIKN